MSAELITSQKLKTLIEKAAEFHGHLGSFLAIGVRMGLIGMERIGEPRWGMMRITVSLPMRVPFSCVVDGLQFSTKCTIGNQKLSLKNSTKIQATFDRRDDGRIIVLLNKSTFQKLKTKLLGEMLSDEEVRKLAIEVASMPEHRLFKVIQGASESNKTNEDMSNGCH